MEINTRWNRYIGTDCTENVNHSGIVIEISQLTIDQTNMPRAFRRNVTKFFILFTFGALVFIILVRSKSVDTSVTKALVRDKNVDRMIREAAIENRERIRHVQRVCEKYKLGAYKTASYDVEFKEPPAPQYGVYYFDIQHNVSYCPIYKSGSTTWIYNLCLLNGVPEEELTSGKEQISTIARRIMPELDYPEADEILKKTAKLIIVRHPFERLLSAYRDKLENSVAGREHGSLHFYKRYGEAIVRKFRDKTRPTPSSNQVIRRPGVPEPAGIEPTWREFVEYLIKTDLASYADDHWTPYYLYCTPCLVDYDLIAKVETLDRDQIYAIHQLGLSGIIVPRWRHATAGSTDAAAVYFSQLTKEHVRKLHDKFKLDFELYDYSAERYYELATSLT